MMLGSILSKHWKALLVVVLLGGGGLYVSHLSSSLESARESVSTLQSALEETTQRLEKQHELNVLAEEGRKRQEAYIASLSELTQEYKETLDDIRREGLSTDAIEPRVGSVLNEWREGLSSSLEAQ